MHESSFIIGMPLYSVRVASVIITMYIFRACTSSPMTTTCYALCTDTHCIQKTHIETYGDKSTTERWEVIDLRGIGRNMSLLAAPVPVPSLDDMESDCCSGSIPL